MEPNGASTLILHDAHAWVVVTLQPVQESCVVLCGHTGREHLRLTQTCNVKTSVVHLSYSKSSQNLLNSDEAGDVENQNAWQWAIQISDFFAWILRFEVRGEYTISNAVRCTCTPTQLGEYPVHS